MDARITIIIIKKGVHSVYFSCVSSVIPFFLFSFIIYDCVFSILSDFAGVVVSGCSYNNNNNNNNNNNDNSNTGLLTTFP